MGKTNFIITPFTREFKIEERIRFDFLEAETAALQKVVEDRQSAVLVGPAGSGKTVVLRALRERLPSARHNIVYLKLADLSSRDMCRQLALGLGLEPVGRYPTLIRSIESRLRSGYEDQGIRQVIIFDDAHEMRVEVLRLLRLMTNFEMDSRLLVSIILSGQLPLKKRLMDPDLEDVRQRLVHCGDLRLLGREEALAYLDHRIKIAGTNISPFTKAAAEALFEVTRGNMRGLDKLGGASLDLAISQKRDAVDQGDVAAVRAKLWM